jgi:hypothetical protein
MRQWTVNAGMADPVGATAAPGAATAGAVAHQAAIDALANAYCEYRIGIALVTGILRRNLQGALHLGHVPVFMIGPVGSGNMS